MGDAQRTGDGCRENSGKKIRKIITIEGGKGQRDKGARLEK